MAPAKLPNSRPRASPRIACYGTVFLAGALDDANLLIRGIAAEAPQFSSPRLDASFLINCGRLLSGHAKTMETPSTYVKRLAGTDFRSPKATVLYECSAQLCGLLGALSAERATEVAPNWYGLSAPPRTKPREPDGRTQIRLEILKNLAAIARQAKIANKMLMLRVEYRKRREYSLSG